VKHDNSRARPEPAVNRPVVRIYATIGSPIEEHPYYASMMERLTREPGRTTRRSAALVLLCIQAITACGPGDPPAGGAAASTSPTIAGVTASGAPSSSPPVAASETAGSLAAPAPSGVPAAPSASAAAEEPGNPFSGAPANPGTPVKIPYAGGFTIAPPPGWTAETDGAKGYVLLKPASGTARVLAAGNEKYSAYDIRQWQFLDLTVTGPPEWAPEKKGRVGATAISATFTRGVGYRFLPGGKRETHKLEQVLVPLVDSAGTARQWVQLIGMWDAAEPHMEREVLEVMKSLR
jgi:hypothetical protein